MHIPENGILTVSDCVEVLQYPHIYDPLGKRVTFLTSKLERVEKEAGELFVQLLKDGAIQLKDDAKDCGVYCLDLLKLCIEKFPKDYHDGAFDSFEKDCTLFQLRQENGGSIEPAEYERAMKKTLLPLADGLMMLLGFKSTKYSDVNLSFVRSHAELKDYYEDVIDAYSIGELELKDECTEEEEVWTNPDDMYASHVL